MTHETDTALGSMPPLEVLYRNHRGEVRKRRIIPLDTPYVGTTDWHPELGWLLRAHDVDKNAERTFACRDFLPLPDPVPGTKARTIDPSMTSDDWLRAAAAWCALDDPDTRRLGIEKLNEIADELYAGATKQTGGDEADDLADRVQAGVVAARAVFEGRVSIDSLADLRRANIARAGQARVSDEEIAKDIAHVARFEMTPRDTLRLPAAYIADLRDARADLADANARIAGTEKAGTREQGLREAARICELCGNPITAYVILAGLDTPEGGVAPC